YEDTFNDEPWECTFGTDGRDGVWVNFSDQVGTLMGSMVWVLILYSVLTISLLAHNQKLPNGIAMFYATICTLALACHAKTTFTDPGSIPQEAVPREALFRKGITTHAMCSHCNTYKPPLSHHCRICNRCVSRMDHHCPWMNNCVGANNFKHFILFLCYTWIACTFALLIFSMNYFFCNSADCTFDSILVQLVRVMTVLCVATLLFVSSMVMNVTYGVMTGVGTIDRLKKKATNTINEGEEAPLGLKDIFGIQGYWTWMFPIDPVFEDYDLVMGYSIPQRLTREKQ
ncbi:zf-DHHC-domain-containing protein, partial [Fragilariopsis cylindrus CCMP1102]